MAQLHGDEPGEIVDDLAVPVIKAFSVRGADWIDHVDAWLADVRSQRRVKAILLDAFSKDARGGTGTQFNWEWVSEARLAGRMVGLPPLILSGGLTPANVSDAIDLVQPWAVDVSSGVESAPGVKDVNKIADFIRSTQEGDQLDSEFWL